MNRKQQETITREVCAKAEEYVAFLRSTARDQADLGRVCTAQDYREAAHVITRLINHIDFLTSR